MKKHKFKVNQVVKIVSSSYLVSKQMIGKIGKIKALSTSKSSGMPMYAVEFDHDNIEFHNCAGHVKSKRGYWCDEDAVEPVANETIVIYRKDDQVIALDKRTGKKAVAKCCPEDLFDFDYGAKLAFLRLTGKTEPEIKKDSIKVGDVVKIINKMLIYSTYDYWTGLGIWKKNFISFGHPDCSKEYNVLTIEKHDQVFDDLALIQHPDSKQVFIIGIEGLEKAQKEG